jgi:hypothetical protein
MQPRSCVAWTHASQPHVDTLRRRTQGAIQAPRVVRVSTLPASAVADGLGTASSVAGGRGIEQLATAWLDSSSHACPTQSDRYIAFNGLRQGEFGVYFVLDQSFDLRTSWMM